MDPGNVPTKAAPVRQMSCSFLNFARYSFPMLLVSAFEPFSLCVGECLVVGQSHFKTFDDKFFTFTGHCQYLLAKDCTHGEFSVIIENVQVKDITSCFKQI